jgi:hypothetical protein
LAPRFRYSRPWASIDNTSGGSFACAAIGSAFALGSSTLMPWVNSGAVIMKMISSTSITSM